MAVSGGGPGGPPGLLGASARASACTTASGTCMPKDKACVAITPHSGRRQSCNQDGWVARGGAASLIANGDSGTGHLGTEAGAKRAAPGSARRSPCLLADYGSNGHSLVAYIHCQDIGE